MVTVNRNGFTRLGKDVARSEPPRWKLVEHTPLGPRLLLTCPSIIFIHGLRGHPQNTWGRGSDEGRNTAPESAPKPTYRLKTFFKREKPRSNSGPRSAPQTRPFWPDEFLTHDIPEAAVWTYGYNSEVMSGLFTPNNQNSVSQHGRDLAERFEWEIDNEHPVIFVAHSLGGIILKEAVRRSKVCQSRTKLIVFLGTPHRGSRTAGWGVIAAKLARLTFSDPNMKLVESLDVDSMALDTIHEEFINILYDLQIQIHSFQEGCGVATIPGRVEKIVDDVSSKLGLPQALERVETLDADHRQMVKCTGREDYRYQTIRGVIQHFIRRSQVDTSSATKITNMTASLSLKAEEPGLNTKEGDQAFFHIPFNLNPRFVGRDDVLFKISTALFTNDGYNKLALVGLGGIGKSQIAIQFAFWVQKNKPEFSVFWLSALSKASFEQSCREIMTECDIKSASATDDNDATTLVKEYLSLKKSGKWVLIVDNVDDAEILGQHIHDFLPKSRDGLMLFTTRSQKIASDLATSKVIRIPEMSPAEAKAYLETLLIQKHLIDDEAATKNLLQTLTHLPLAITQAAAFINSNGVASIAEYLELFNHADENMVELLSSDFRDETRYPESANAVVSSWLVSFNQINETDTVAARLLLFLAWVEPKAIPKSMLPQKPEIHLSRAIGTLLGYGFLSQRKESGIYDMHSLVHLVTQTWNSNQENHTYTLTEAVSQIISVFPSINWENRELWRQFLPHALRALQNTELSHESSELGHLVGISLLKDRRDQEAVEVLERVFQFKNEALAEDDPSRLASQHVLAIAYKNNGQIGEAVHLLESVTLIESALAEDDPSRLAPQHVLATAYRDNGQIGEAVHLLESVTLIESALAEGHPSRLASQYALANAYRKNGQVEEAVSLLEKVVFIDTDLLAEGHPDRLASQYALANAYRDNGQVEEAVSLLEKVVFMDTGLLAEDHPNRLKSQQALALTYRKRGQVEEAIKIQEQVVLIKQNTLAEDHPDRLVSEEHLQCFYKRYYE
ncbi:unnamed protein product [Clonostachys rosea]|uniref:NB-ARC domain-containing protein n=1 Tax=Bionectria ochroleuca TaxID=29856 RepID=A0ABY6U3F2_BIOOC|nr:unnamed protein product [Clonostachys rosea]